MTKEELQEFLKDEKNKSLFDEIAKSLGYETSDDVQGLKNKRDQLLDKIKKMKSEYDEKLKVLDNIDIEAYNDYIDNKSGKDKNDRELARLTKENEDLKIKYDKIDSEFNNSIKLQRINEALDENGIDSNHKKILTSAFLGKASVEIDGDSRNVIIDDDGLGLPPKEYFKKWIETDGKAYLKKPDNSGGSTSGFSSGSQTITRAEFDKLPSNEKMSLIEKGVQPID